ncbi:helix-turn-helix domain-containing protein [Symbiopectobacterium purcellii]|uniref:helix-turn-helix domain-containing protein n=1 Tax=Symbiopectobacterium purcellii TaxID=2871826 RepID=UPI003F8528A3
MKNLFNFTPYYSLLPKLSKREIEVLVLSSFGFSVNEIALELNISTGTVNVHLCNAKHKYERDTYGDLRALFYFKFYNASLDFRNANN